MNMKIRCIVMIFLTSCNNFNEIDHAVINKYKECVNKDSIVIDFSKEVSFDWDSMYYFSGAYSLENINSVLGRKIYGWTEVGDRLIFVFRGRIVRHYEWFKEADSSPCGTVFLFENRDFFSVSRFQSKFFINKKDQLYILLPCDEN